MASSSKMVRLRFKAAAWLRASLKAHGFEAARGLEPRIAKVLRPGEEAPDVTHFLDVMGRVLLHEARELHGADGERWDEAADAQGLQRERRHAAADFRSWLVGFRRNLVGLFGEKKTRELLEIRGRTPRSQEELRDYADWLLSRMATWELPPARHRAAFSAKVWRNELKPLAERLVGLSRRRELQETDRYLALAERDQQLADFTRDYRRVLHLARIIYLLGGQEKLAGYVELQLRRPFNSRPAKSANADLEPTLSDSAPTSGGPVARVRRWCSGLVRGVRSFFGRRRAPLEPMRELVETADLADQSPLSP